VSPRRGVAALLALALIGGGAGVASAQAATATSANWAGYAVRKTGTAFRHVSGTWTVPAVDCTTGAESYSANWVGLGGYSSSAKALEQLGTESDCSRSGTASYSAWFEVVPTAATTARMTIEAGDVVRASAAVRGTLVTLKLTDLTRGKTITKTVRAGVVDVSSAEWIVEAPSLCDGTTTSDASCAQSALANFGSTGFSAASATTSAGHTGTILDAAWTPVAITLRASARGGPGGFLPGGGGPGRGRGGLEPASSGGATPGALTASGDGFGVTYGDGTTTGAGAA
jgi:hypothetical protein